MIGGLGFQHVERQRHELVEQLATDQHVHPERHGLHDPRPGMLEQQIESDHENHADQQAPKSADAGVRDHPVVHLHGEQRHPEGQQVHERRHRQYLAEYRPQRLHEGLEPRTLVGGAHVRKIYVREGADTSPC